MHKHAIPTIALMTSLASICGTNVKTMIVDSRANATTMVGVSRAVPDRKFDLGADWEDTERRSESSFKNAVSDATIGAYLVIQER